MARAPFESGECGFARRLADKAMASLFDDWIRLTRAASGRLPAYQEFDPFRFATLMPSLQVFERTPDARWRQRLAGETVAENVGANNKGRFLEEIVEPGDLAIRTASLDRAVDAGLPGAMRGLLSRPSTEVEVFKRLLLPFAPGIVVCYVVFARLRDAPDLQSGGSIQAIWASAADVA